MYEQTVENVTVGLPPTVTPETPVSEAAEYLRGIRVPALPVLEGDTVVGMVTESDFAALVTETDDRPTVQTIMSAPAATISPFTTLGEAAATMRSAGVKHLPVISDGVYSGVLSAESLAPYLSRRRLDLERRNEPLRVNSAMNQPMRASD
ncbi:cyclic nucleotide-binding/CBS domain-containing protein [Saliphagus sp. LR7]|uniref:CBS domain-containing protein n=1 Tax=Saliphagus sp. LR7 TaxID=2282654 RepID=UPI000DF7AAC5|nr:CBS domain-containing protein [Saliphagus sp. LR7]